MSIIKSLLLSVTAACVAFAQQPPPVKSPEVHSDGRVTFRLRAPDAHKLLVSLEGVKDPFTMQKDDTGVWSYTTGALAPNLYGYEFKADGVSLIDPSNSAIKPNLLHLTNIVLVPGPSPLPWEQRDIPHGAIQHHFYKSNVVGDNRDYYVYTPPGYDPNGQALYPVLYLLHGYSDDASGWTAVGKANFILDALIAEGKAKPMIVVMPLGYGAPEIVQRPLFSLSSEKRAELGELNITRFRQALIEEVIPAVEKDYRAAKDRDSRAIAGLSMGGAESLMTGLNRLDLFSWIGSFSAGGLKPNFESDFPQLNSSANDKIHLLWIACGTEDGLITPNRQVISWLKGKGIQLTAIETPGMHTWMVWRHNLIDFAPLLFNKASANAPPAAEPAK
jgi:enterochelin esterase-like enzyme